MLFFGGWLSPFDGYLSADAAIRDVPVIGSSSATASTGCALKIAVFLFLFLWVRATFPRYRYDQIMRLGWKVLIPVTLVWIAVEGVLAWLEVGPWAA